MFIKQPISAFVFLFKAILLLSFVTQVSSFAASVDGIYSAEVEVNDRTKSSFEKGLRQALLKVLAKNTPSTIRDIRANPHLAGDLKRGHKYVEQFSYQLKGEDTDSPQLYLKASFPHAVINDFLQRGGLSLWPANRPSTLIIPVLKVNGALSLNNSVADLDGLYKDMAFKHGIALAGNDLQRKISRKYLRDYWNWNVAGINAATESIQHDAVFTGRIAVTSSGVRGGWMLLQGDKKYSIDIQAQSVGQFVDKGFAWLARLWSKQYAINLQLSGNEQLLMVGGISNHAQYMQLMAYLKKLDVVDQVYLLQLESDKVTMAVALKSDVQQFAKTLKRSRHLKLQSDAEGQMTYLWH
ncbi:MAG: DUF2066 domain-containing protein [Pseudomonadales bacterium]|nr:DUF2066 domain-containing protein [Pseudomonadales bacterium]